MMNLLETKYPNCNLKLSTNSPIKPQYWSLFVFWGFSLEKTTQKLTSFVLKTQ